MNFIAEHLTFNFTYATIQSDFQNQTVYYSTSVNNIAYERTGKFMGKLFKEFNDEKWEQVRTHPYFSKAIESITRRAEDMLKTEPPRVKFSDIHLFVETGNRSVFQNVYSDYQSRMEVYFFMYLLTKDEKYISPLSDIIWNICDFEAWSIPAHVSEGLPEEARKTWLDLCSTIMGFRISEILYFIGDKLPQLVRKRAMYEIRYRVIESYKKNNFGWTKAENNWSAVCIAAVLATYLYAGTEEETNEQLPRMIETAKCYLRGFDEEGCCIEGYSYWHYGFSYFCLFASLLSEYTDGKIDMFKDEKVHAIARFQQNSCINPTQCISFSDCGNGSFKPFPWLSHFLKKVYPDIEIPPIPPSNSGAAALRYILWQEPELADCRMYPKNHIYHNTQWFIYRSPAYNIACKAGCNNESHNHNDVGSFVLSKNDKVTFTDPGGGEYTRQYFSSERYTILATSSRGHSVPIINGQFQVTGKTKSTVFTEEENHYAFSMENAYAVPTLISLKRDVQCLSDTVVLTDLYEFSEKPESVVERFVTFSKPEVTDEGIKCGDSILSYDSNVCRVSFGQEPVIRSSDHSDMLYFVDINVINPDKKFSVSVRIR